MSREVSIELLSASFGRWDELLALINRSFAYMDGVIDPPSSAKLLTPQKISAKAQAETCFLAMDGARIAGCVFIEQRPGCLYIGKLAIAEDMQRRGLGRKLVQAAAQLARDRGIAELELQTRVELTGNQAAFFHLGFRETARTSHAGYVHPTSVTMRKVL